MRQSNWNVRSAVRRSLTLALLLAIPALALPGSLAQEEDPWVAEEAAASQPAPRTAGILPAPGEPGLHDGHLGYDKDTGQALDDPTVRTPAARTPEELRQLQRAAQEKRQQVDPTRITFRSGVTIHPRSGTAGILPALRAAGDGYYLIQFIYPFPTAARYRLEEAGVTFYDYVDVSGFYAQIPPQAAELLERLMAEGLVRYVGEVPPEAKLSPAMAAQATAGAAEQQAVTVLTFEQPTPAQLEELQGLMIIDRRSDGPMHILEGRASPSGVQALARLGYVRWVEEQPLNTPGNLDGGMGVASDVLRDFGFDGTDVNVMVVDTGIACSGTTYHPDLLSGRIVDQYDYQNGDTNAADDHSHGTHVAGSIGGRFNSGDVDSDRSWQGVAPGVDFLVYKLCCGTNQFSSTWFQQALERGTSSGRTTDISNNSWGGGNGVYNTNSEIADRAVRGEYNSQKINMVIISHNDDDLARAPSTGKNVITVGAVKDGNYPDTPFASCGGTDEINWPPGQRVCYSNYGPIDIDGDGHTRVKPDVMAPGSMINSPVPWYLYGDSRHYDFKHGTSMAAPHVSGAIAQILDAHSSSKPWLFDWPEIVKAMVLATAVDVGGDTDTYGHGLIDPYHAIYYQSGIAASMSFWGNSVSTSGETKDFTFNVPSGYEEVRVVLTWADPAGSTEVNNDLDISSIKDAGGTHRGGSSKFDDTVEYVTVGSGGTPGTWTVTVRGFSLSSAQAFGLAAIPILADADLTISASTPASVDPGEYFYFHQYVSNSGYTAGGSYARLYVPAGFTVQGVRVYTNDDHSHWYDDSEIYHPSGSNYWRVAIGETVAWYSRHLRWYIQANSGTAKGDYSFSSTAYWRDSGSLQGSDVIVTGVAVNGEPDAPSSLGASGVSPTRINLSWTDNSDDESGFKIERWPTGATSWTQIDTVEADLTAYADTGLQPGTTCYYRVRAYNSVGNSGYSNTTSATTDFAVYLPVVRRQ